MKLPTDLFLKGIAAKKVYHFSSKQLNTAVPHYFICITQTLEESIILVCTTTQFKKRANYIEKVGLPFSTLVRIKPNAENGLIQESYVDCNSYFMYEQEEFRRMYEQDNIDYKGIIDEAVFDELMRGLLDSPKVEENIKELIRNIIL